MTRSGFCSSIAMCSLAASRSLAVVRTGMQASVVTGALRMAWFRRRPEPGLIFHSNRGSQ